MYGVENPEGGTRGMEKTPGQAPDTGVLPEVGTGRIVVAHGNGDVEKITLGLDHVASVLPLPCGHHLYLDGRGLPLGCGTTPEGARFSHTCTLAERHELACQRAAALQHRVAEAERAVARCWAKLGTLEDHLTSMVSALNRRIDNAGANVRILEDIIQCHDITLNEHVRRGSQPK